MCIGVMNQSHYADRLLFAPGMDLYYSPLLIIHKTKAITDITDILFLCEGTMGNKGAEGAREGGGLGEAKQVK